MNDYMIRIRQYNGISTVLRVGHVESTLKTLHFMRKCLGFVCITSFFSLMYVCFSVFVCILYTLTTFKERDRQTNQEFFSHFHVCLYCYLRPSCIPLSFFLQKRKQENFPESFHSFLILLHFFFFRTRMEMILLGTYLYEIVIWALQCGHHPPPTYIYVLHTTTRAIIIWRSAHLCIWSFSPLQNYVFLWEKSKLVYCMRKGTTRTVFFHFSQTSTHQNLHQP